MPLPYLTSDRLVVQCVRPQQVSELVVGQAESISGAPLVEAGVGQGLAEQTCFEVAHRSAKIDLPLPLREGAGGRGLRK